MESGISSLTRRGCPSLANDDKLRLRLTKAPLLGPLGPGDRGSGRSASQRMMCHSRSKIAFRRGVLKQGQHAIHRLLKG